MITIDKFSHFLGLNKAQKRYMTRFAAFRSRHKKDETFTVFFERIKESGNWTDLIDSAFYWGTEYNFWSDLSVKWSKEVNTASGN